MSLIRECFIRHAVQALDDCTVDAFSGARLLIPLLDRDGGGTAFHNDPVVKDVYEHGKHDFPVCLCLAMH
jgi:hypothetical protein